MSKLIELRLKKTALQKKMDMLEAELELVYHEIDNVMEEQLDDETATPAPKQDGMFFTNEELHKLLTVLDHSKAEHDNPRLVSKLIDINHEYSWDIADHLGYDMNEGYIDPETLSHKLYKNVD